MVFQLEKFETVTIPQVLNILFILQGIKQTRSVESSLFDRCN